MKNTFVNQGESAFPAINGDGTVTIADSNLLLSGAYSRDGDDLIITGQEGQQLHVVEYFSQNTPPALISNDGKMLSGDTVSLLAGPLAPGQYAQASGGQFGEPIGQVETLNGSANAQRTNGLKVELEVGSPVFQGDVVSAGSGSTLGITFIDKTVFTIDNGATMVLNEMVYSPSGSSNSMLFNLLGGTAAFVAGAIAKTGDMKVETPVAVMAIRGTWPLASCDLSGSSCSFYTESGVYDLLHKLRGKVLTTVDDPSQIVTLRDIDGTPLTSGPSAAQMEMILKVFGHLHGTVEVLDKRLEDGENPVRKASTESLNYADGGGLGDIGGLTGLLSKAFVNLEGLLDPTSFEQTTVVRQVETVQLMDPPPPSIAATQTDEDTTTTVSVFTGPDTTGPTPRIISAEIVSGLGTVSISDDAKAFVYNPGSAYNSLSAGDTAQVRISVLIDVGDGTMRTDEAIVTVVGVNDMPEAQSDTAVANEGAAVSIDVLENDSDPDTNDELEVSQASITSGLGTVTIAANGQSILYDPAGAYDHLSIGETAVVVITYQVSDGEGGTASSTATVTVSGLNEAPAVTRADDDGNVTERPDGSAGENTVVLSTAGIIAFSDVDHGDSHVISVKPDGAGYRGTLTAGVTNTATGDGTGALAWQFNVNDAAIDNLAASQTLVQNYTIAIDDGNGGIATQKVSISLHGTNDAPSIAGPAAQAGTVTEGEGSQVHSATGLINFMDVDLADGHSVSVAENGTDFRGTLIAQLSNSATGDGSGAVTWNYQVNDADLNDLAANQTVTQNYTLTIRDGNGGTATETVSVTLEGSNDAPAFLDGPGSGTVTELTDNDAGENSQLLSASGVLNFGDADLSDSHSVTVAEQGTGYRGTLTPTVSNSAQGDGTGAIAWTFVVSDGQLDNLLGGQELNQTYIVTIDDGNGGTSSQNVNIKLIGTNDGPVIIGADDTGVVTEIADGAPGENVDDLIATGSLTIGDDDLGDIASVTVSPDGSGFRGSMTAAVSDANPSIIDWTFAVNDAAVDDLANGETRVQKYTLNVTDSSGAAVSQVIAITIFGNNDAPVISSPTGNGSVNELADGATGENATTLSASGALNFADVDLADGHTVSVIEADEGFRGSLTASISDPSQGDGNGNVAWAFNVADADLDNLAAGQSLVQTYSVVVTDDFGATDTQQVTVTVTGSNDAPVFVSGPDTGAVTEASGETGPVNLTDQGTLDFGDVDLSDGHTVSVTSNGSDFRGTLSAVISDASQGDGSGEITWTFSVNRADLNDLASGQSLSQTYTVAVTDPFGASDTQTVQISINGTNDAPVISSGPGSATITDQSTGGPTVHNANGTLAFGDADLADGHTVSVTSGTGDFLGSLTASISDPSQGDGTGQIAWAFSVNDSDIESLADGETVVQTYTLQVDDGNGGTDTQQVAITIVGSNGPPVITAADATGAVTEFDEDAEVPDAHDAVTGTVDFTDSDLGNAHTVSVAANETGYFGVLSVVVSDSAASDGVGQVSWAFNINDSEINHLGEGDVVQQAYTVTIDDGDGGTVDQLVTITITGRNDSPIITSGPGNGSVTELTDGAAGENAQTLTAQGTLNFGDADLIDGHSVSFTELGTGYRGSLTPVISNASQGDGTGQILWTFSVNDAALDDLGAGQELIQTYVVTVDDGNGGTSSRNVVITLTGSNDGPVIIDADDKGTVTEITDGAAGENVADLTATGSITIADDDLGDITTVSVTPHGGGFRGTMNAVVSSSDPSVINWTYNVNDAVVDDLAAGETRIQSYTLKMTDNAGADATLTVEITINGTNDAPIITGGPGSATVTELSSGSTVHSSNGSIAFGDVDLSDSHTITVTPAGSGFFGSLTASVSDPSQGDGTGLIAWAFSVNDADLNGLAANETVVQLYTLKIDDGKGGTDTQTVAITVIGSNDAPVITAADGSGAITELVDGAADENTAPLSENGTITFTDADLSDSHTVSVSSIGATPRGNLTASITGTTVTWVYAVIAGALDDLAAGESVVQSYRVTISDGQGGTDNQIVDITLTGTNDVAIISGTSTGAVVAEDAIDTIGGLLTVVDPDVRQSGTPEAAFTAAVIVGTYGELTMTTTGVWSYTLDNTASSTLGLASGSTAFDGFTVSTVDGTTQNINITVEAGGFDVESFDFSGNSGSSRVKSLSGGSLQSIDIDLLVTPMPLSDTVNSGANDIGVGAGQDIAFDQGLRFEVLSQFDIADQNDVSSLTYESHIALSMFQAQMIDIQGNQSQTASVQLRIINADDDTNFDTVNDAGDVVVPLSASDVSVMIASGNSGNFNIQQFGDTVVITGLQQGDTFIIESPTAFNRVEVENISETFGGNDFALGQLGFNFPDSLFLTGDGSSTPLIGAASNDFLNSGPGQQSLTGGKGIDLFMFDGTASTGALADLITDYEQNIDVIDLTALFDVATNDFNEGAVQEFVRYKSSSDNDGASDPAGVAGDLFLDADGAANGENFILLAHSATATDNIIVKVDDDASNIGYVTII